MALAMGLHQRRLFGLLDCRLSDVFGSAGRVRGYFVVGPVACHILHHLVRGVYLVVAMV